MKQEIGKKGKEEEDDDDDDDDEKGTGELTANRVKFQARPEQHQAEQQIELMPGRK